MQSYCTYAALPLVKMETVTCTQAGGNICVSAQRHFNIIIDFFVCIVGGEGGGSGENSLRLLKKLNTTALKEKKNEKTQT